MRQKVTTMNVTLAPRGKRVTIGNEAVEVWSKHCTNGHHCIQCFFTGKFGCAPRFWFQKPVILPPDPPHKRGFYDSLISLEATTRDGYTVADYLVAQPAIPIPDGGHTEEMTEAISSCPIFKRSLPYRVIDQDCPRCGYSYLSFWNNGSKHNGYKKRYWCRNCGRIYTEGSRRILEMITPYLRELREQDITRRETIELIDKRYGIKLKLHSYHRLVKAMG